MSPSNAPPSSTDLPLSAQPGTAIRRRFISEGHREALDRHGFLDTERTETMGADEVFVPGATLVWGQPWLGKSFVAWQIERSHFAGADPAVAGRFARTRFDVLPGFSAIVPPWWGDWAAAPAAPASWVIDGLDEGVDHDVRTGRSIIALLQQLAASHLAVLTLVVFSRYRPELSEFVSELSDPFRAARLRVREYWLARLDRVSAADLVGPAILTQVTDLIDRNRLRGVGGLPAVLTFLGNQPPGADLTVRQVWKGILEEQLKEPRANRRAALQSELRARYEATQRLAAVMTLTGSAAVRAESRNDAEPAIDNIFPADAAHRLAAREACGLGAFVGLPERGAYRFIHRNVHDWFAAFALSRLGLAALRQAVAGSDRRPFGRHREVLRLLRVIVERREVQDAIDAMFGGATFPPDAAAPDPEHVRQCLDHLEALAAQAPGGLPVLYDDRSEFYRLKVAGTDEELARRLSDRARTAERLGVLLAVAEEAGGRDSGEAALAILADNTRPPSLRRVALGVASSLIRDAALWRSIDHMATPPQGGDDGGLWAAVALRLYRVGAWDYRRLAETAARRPDERTEAEFRIRHVLDTEITPAHARSLLPILPSLLRELAVETDSGRVPFLGKALDLLAADDALTDQERVALADGVLRSTGSEDPNYHAARAVFRRFHDSPAVRRRFFTSAAERWRAGDTGWSIWGYQSLTADDWDWLFGQMHGEWSDCHQGWEVLYVLADRARSADPASATEWEIKLARIENARPGTQARMEEQRQKAEERERELQAMESELRERQPVQRQLSELLEVWLGQPAPPSSRVRNIGAACFGQEWLRMPVKGTWAELSPDLRTRTLATLRELLDEAEPSPPPTESRFSGDLLAEGAAVLAVLDDPTTPDGWLTPERVRRWLPAALILPQDDRCARLLRACQAVDADGTTEAIVRLARWEVSVSELLVGLSSVPSECWTGALVGHILDLALDEGLSPGSRATALRLAAAHAPERAAAIAMQWAARPNGRRWASDPLRSAGRNVLLANDPARVLDILERVPNRFLGKALVELSGLWEPIGRVTGKTRRWPLAARARLVDLLFNAFPPSNDPDDRHGWMTPEKELISIRDGLIYEILQDPGEEAEKVADELAEQNPDVHKIVRKHRAGLRARQFIASGSPESPPPEPAAAVPQHSGPDLSVLTLPEALALLDRSEYRLLRSRDDLLDAVTEVIAEVGKDAREDLALLYHPPVKGEPRKRLLEDALQAYFRRRLRDLLPQRIQAVPFEALREDVVQLGDKLDIRVVAPVRGPDRLAQVVIEVKWSDNTSVKQSLVTQLGQRYLVREGKTHGVYLVGWAGKWDAKSGSDATPTGLRTFLANQAEEFTQAGSAGDGCRIVPVVLDLSFPSDRKGAKRKQLK